MNKKGGKLTKSVELIYKLSRDKSFRNDVKKIREESSKFPPGSSSTLLTTVDVLKKYSLPITYYWEMNQYIYYHNLNFTGNQELTTLSIKYPDNQKLSTGNEKTFKKLGLPYVGLYIHDASSKEGVIKLITKHWQKIKKSLVAQGGNVSRIRTSKNKERNLQISILNEETKTNLYKIARIDKNKRMNMYKEQLIAQIMRDRGYTKVTFEMVKKYILTPQIHTDKLRVKRSFGKHHN
jgi:hypothetical protein